MGRVWQVAKSVNSARLSLSHEQSCKRHPDSEALFSLPLLKSRQSSLWETSETLLLHVFCAHAEHLQEQVCIFLSFSLVAQLAEHRTGTPPTQVQFSSVARDFSPSQLSVQTLLQCQYTPMHNCIHLHLCAC